MLQDYGIRAARSKYQTQIYSLLKDSSPGAAHFTFNTLLQDSGIGANKTLYAEARSNSPGYSMYDDAVQRDVLVKNATGDILIGKVGYSGLLQNIKRIFILFNCDCMFLY